MFCWESDCGDASCRNIYFGPSACSKHWDAHQQAASVPFNPTARQGLWGGWSNKNDWTHLMRLYCKMPAARAYARSLGSIFNKARRQTSWDAASSRSSRSLYCSVYLWVHVCVHIRVHVHVRVGDRLFIHSSRFVKRKAGEVLGRQGLKAYEKWAGRSRQIGWALQGWPSRCALIVRLYAIQIIRVCWVKVH